jgi:DNA adenine methylase
LEPPYCYVGGKSRIAHEIWKRFGKLDTYIEPFLGSGAVLLARPQPIRGKEVVNDASGFISNFWRAIRADADAVAQWTMQPINENELHASHIWLVGYSDVLASRLEADKDFFDAEAAGRWCKCTREMIARCPGADNGPWRIVEEDGVKHLRYQKKGSGPGIQRSIIAENGIHRSVFKTNIPSDRGDFDEFELLANRLCNVHVCCGDWSRICKPSFLGYAKERTGIYLDPPYSADSDCDQTMYQKTGDGDVAHDVREWCLANGSERMYRIALSGYEGEGHEELEKAGWSVLKWKAGIGFAAGKKDGSNKNRFRERIWFSPHCIKPERGLLDR